MTPVIKTATFSGITRVRNEELLIRNTLDHFYAMCNNGLYVYDDASTDGTRAICSHHAGVKWLSSISQQSCLQEGQQSEGQQRATALQAAENLVPSGGWIICFDADERFEIDLQNIDFSNIDAIKMRLYDFYITPEDIEKQWYERQWIGPEYREIITIWRSPLGHFQEGLRRAPTMEHGCRIITAGSVRHYGKALSIDDWERKCRLYSTNSFPKEYREKWRNRHGKAVKTDMMSDFGRPLIKWEDRDRNG